MVFTPKAEIKMDVIGPPCVNCGYCCRQAPCDWGDRTSAADRTCRHLVADPSRPGRWLCGIYDQIIGQPTSEVAPAFGAGCCASLNSFRRTILEAGSFTIYNPASDEGQTRV